MDRFTDMTFLKNFTGGNPEKIKKYVSMFLQLCPDQLNVMQGHLHSSNYDSLRASAHALKPQIIYMGIRRGEELVKAIEHHAGNKTDIEKLPDMMNEFRNVCHKAMDELRLEIA